MAATWGGSRSAAGGSQHMAGATGREGGHRLALADDRQDVARRVLEPGDRWPAAAEDAPVVLVEALVAFEAHPALDEGVHGPLDVGHGEVEDRVGRRGVIGLGVDQDAPVAGDAQVERAVLFVHAQPQGLPVELLGLLQVRYREAAEGLAVREHALLLSGGGSAVVGSGRQPGYRLGVTGPGTGAGSGCRGPGAGPAAGPPAAAGRPRRRPAGAGRPARTGGRRAGGCSGRRPGRWRPSRARGRTAARPGSRRQAAGASPGSGTGVPTAAPGGPPGPPGTAAARRRSR